MTKRFTMDSPNDWGFPITDNVTGKVYSCDSNMMMKDLCKVVNGIVEENEQLKSDNKCYVKRYSELFEDYIACKKENEQLKKQRYDLYSDIARLVEENEQLKSENNMLKVTIGRNEAYIKRLTETSIWRC